MFRRPPVVGKSYEKGAVLRGRGRPQEARVAWEGRADPSLVLSVACNQTSLIGDKSYFIKPRRFSISHDCWHSPPVHHHSQTCHLRCAVAAVHKRRNFVLASVSNGTLGSLGRPGSRRRPASMLRSMMHLVLSKPSCRCRSMPKAGMQN